MFSRVIPSLAVLSTSFVLHNMKILVISLFSVVFIHGTALPTAFTQHLVRVPTKDSAIIRSDRLGGNFGYSTIERHAYAAMAPILQNIATPMTMAGSTVVPSVNDPKTAYALESATLPKEHRGLPLNFRATPLATRHIKG